MKIAQPGWFAFENNFHSATMINTATAIARIIKNAIINKLNKCETYTRYGGDYQLQKYNKFLIVQNFG